MHAADRGEFHLRRGEKAVEELHAGDEAVLVEHPRDVACFAVREPTTPAEQCHGLARLDLVPVVAMAHRTL